jgi:hypothetical protein
VGICQCSVLAAGDSKPCFSRYTIFVAVTLGVAYILRCKALFSSHYYLVSSWVFIAGAARESARSLKSLGLQRDHLDRGVAPNEQGQEGERHTSRRQADLPAIRSAGILLISSFVLVFVLVVALVGLFC